MFIYLYFFCLLLLYYYYFFFTLLLLLKFTAFSYFPLLLTVVLSFINSLRPQKTFAVFVVYNVFNSTQVIVSDKKQFFFCVCTKYAHCLKHCHLYIFLEDFRLSISVFRTQNIMSLSNPKC